MKRIFQILLLLTLYASGLFGQEENPYEELLQEKVVNENPVYKPVIGIGTGVFNFHGDVRNNYLSPTIGNFGYKFNVTTFLDQNHYLKLNLMFLYGRVSGNQQAPENTPGANLNFQTDLVDFGFNLEYSFDHFIPEFVFIRPFVSLGIENLQFTPKGDLYYKGTDGSLSEYHYWTDGTIRDVSQTGPDAGSASVLHRDYIYETDLRNREKKEFGLGTYNKSTLALPLDIGLSMKISERVTFRLGTSVHFTFTDYLDNVSSEGTSIVGKKGNDILSYNYVSLHFDLFSEPKEQIIEKMFAELEFDPVMFDDEDGDFILDGVDLCPGTPYGVAVDTLGCPLDADEDGIPDYLDKEKFSRPGAWVDTDGVTVQEDEYLRSLLSRSDAMSRDDVKAYFEIIGKGYVIKKVEEIPGKFVELDTNNDGYISFEELLQSIDNYFDGKLTLTVEDIYDLNNFFFRQ